MSETRLTGPGPRLDPDFVVFLGALAGSYGSLAPSKKLSLWMNWQSQRAKSTEPASSSKSAPPLNASAVKALAPQAKLEAEFAHQERARLLREASAIQRSSPDVTVGVSHARDVRLDQIWRRIKHLESRHPAIKNAF